MIAFLYAICITSLLRGIAPLSVGIFKRKEYW